MFGCEPLGKEAYFELDAPCHRYRVLHCTPKPAKEPHRQELEQVSDDRTFGAFRTRMRELFVEAIK